MESPLCSNSFPLLLVLGWGLVESSLAHLSLHPLLHLLWSPRLPSIFTSSASPLSFLSMRSTRGPLLFVKMLSLMLSPILVWYAVFAPHYPFLGRAPYFFQLFSQIKVSFLSSPSHPALPKKSVSFLCNHWSHTPTFPWCQHMQLHQHLLSYFFPRAACICVQALERGTLAWWFPRTDLWIFNVTFNLLFKELGAPGGWKLKFWNIKSEILE